MSTEVKTVGFFNIFIKDLKVITSRLIKCTNIKTNNKIIRKVSRYLKLNIKIRLILNGKYLENINRYRH